MIFMQKKIYKNNGGGTSGFTLIEILIVVAIISILASIVLVGIGPTEQLGRDARRISDLHEVQTALELYYAKCGYYPGGAVDGNSHCTGIQQIGYATLATNIVASNLGVQSMPNDPQSGKKYYYSTLADGSSYLLGATLENKNGSVFSGYNAPSSTNYGGDTFACASPNYCLSL